MHLLRLPTAALLALLLAACGAEGPSTGAPETPEPAADAPAAESAGTTAADASAEADALDPAAFELDMARVDRWFDATRRLGELTAKDPSLEEVTAADASEPRAAYVARLEAHPAVSAAIEDAGMTATEYALTTEALVGALFAVGMLEAGAIQELPAELKDTQAVAFVQAHKDELTARMQAMQRGED